MVEELCKLHLHDTVFFEFNERLYVKIACPVKFQNKTFHALRLDDRELKFPLDFSEVIPLEVEMIKV